jgi:hypothetical protein
VDAADLMRLAILGLLLACAFTLGRSAQDRRRDRFLKIADREGISGLDETIHNAARPNSVIHTRTSQEAWLENP